MLFQIASLLGLPLRLDAATATLKRPSVARLQVEVDLLQPRPRQVWIGVGEKDGFWQRVDFEKVPPYCLVCWHVGHEDQLCRSRRKELNKIVPTALEKPFMDSNSREEQIHIPVPSSKEARADGNSPVVPVATVPDYGNPKPAVMNVVDPTQNVGDAVVKPMEGGSMQSNPANTKDGKNCSQPARRNDTTVSAPAATDLPQSNKPGAISAAVVATDVVLMQNADTEAAFQTAYADSDGEAPPEANHPRKLPVIFCADSDPEEDEEISSNQQVLASSVPQSVPISQNYVPIVPDDQSAPYALPSSAEFPLLQSPVPGAKNVSTGQPTISGKSKRLNVDAAAWIPKDRAGTSINLDLDRRTLLAQSGRLLPPSFDTSTSFQTEQQFQEWVTDDEPEEEDKEAAMENFLDSEAVRDDLYVEKRNNTEARRERDSVLLRRGRARPLGSQIRTYFDLPRQSGRSNKGVPPKHYEPGL